MFKAKNLIFTTFVIIAASAVSFFILRNLGFFKAETAQNQVQNGLAKNNTDEQTITLEPVPVLPADSLKSQMPDLSRPVVVTSNIADDLRVQFTQEIKTLSTSLKEDFNHLDLWLQVGILRKFIGDYEGARQAWEFANLGWPQNAISFNNLGELYGFYLKDYPKSEKNYLKSIENDPKNIDAYKNLATIYQYSYTERQAQIPLLLQRGIVNNPQNIDFMFMLARYYADNGNKVGAAAYYNNILQIDPNNKNAKEELAQIQ